MPDKSYFVFLRLYGRLSPGYGGELWGFLRGNFNVWPPSPGCVINRSMSAISMGTNADKFS